jgi:hypothetical protein
VMIQPCREVTIQEAHITICVLGVGLAKRPFCRNQVFVLTLQ